MLDVACTHCPSATMTSVDWTPYLLASSPPSSSLEFHSYSFASSGYQHYPPLSTFPSPDTPADREQGTSVVSLSSSRRRGQRPLKPIIVRADSDGEQSSGNTSEGEGSSPSSPCSPGRVRKHVSFADCCGKALAEVRIMSEPSDHPPNLNPEILASLTQGAQAKVTGKPPLRLTFPQPASDYLAFRDRIEQNMVSLENVLLKDYSVAGTIKVKNIAFEKSVFVRITTSSWERHQDVGALYAPRPGDLPGRPSCHDTFTFQFDVPPKSDTSKRVEFAVCFDSGARQFWDNNGGANYGIVWETFEEPAVVVAPPVVASPVGAVQKNGSLVFGPSSLTDFACWHHVDTSTPYY